jgi:hypothetical protein
MPWHKRQGDSAGMRNRCETGMRCRTCVDHAAVKPTAIEDEIATGNPITVA